MKNQKDLAYLILIVVIVLIGTGGLLYFSWQKGLIKNLSAPITGKDGDIEIIEVSLDVKAPFSEASIIVNREGTITYSAKREDKQEETKSNTITTKQLENLNNLILENKFFSSLEEKPKNPGDPEDGSYYYLSVKYYPGKPLEPMFPSHKTVYCYQFNCEPAFLEMKDKIIELWGNEVLEVGI